MKVESYLSIMKYIISDFLSGVDSGIPYSLISVI